MLAKFFTETMTEVQGLGPQNSTCT